VTDVWPIVHAEREALIRDLEGLDGDAWEQPSLCPGWSVHDVAAHLVDTARTTRVSFVLGLVLARFDFDLQNERGIRRARGASPKETLRRMREVVHRTSTPPAPLDTRIVEEIVHGEDIRRPLGISRSYPPEAVIRAFDDQVRTPASFGGAKELITRVQLAATDEDVAVGEGPQVVGPILSLLLVASGRSVAIRDLTGPGIDTLVATGA
jgi:uncharacterized protein (TIGR03083 family)